MPVFPNVRHYLGAKDWENPEKMEKSSGDLFHHPLEFDEPGRHPVWAEAQSAQASKSMLAQRAAESGAQVFFTHSEGAYRVERSSQTLSWKKISD